MLPLDPDDSRAVAALLALAPTGPGLLALRHALTFRLPGIRVDARISSKSRSLILVREGDDGRLEAFGAGVPEPALAWLVEKKRPFTLHAPEPWSPALQSRVGSADVELASVETWSRGHSPPTTRAYTRRLIPPDIDAFMAFAPPWALRGWRSYEALIDQGAAYGVPLGSGFASLAWVFDQDKSYASIGLFTSARYRRLGLGLSAASALVTDIVQQGRIPLWSTLSTNLTSVSTARSLGFSLLATAPLLLWTPPAASS